jgi:hypothetical protein
MSETYSIRESIKYIYIYIDFQHIGSADSGDTTGSLLQKYLGHNFVIILKLFAYISDYFCHSLQTPCSEGGPTYVNKNFVLDSLNFFFKQT